MLETRRAQRKFFPARVKSELIAKKQKRCCENVFAIINPGQNPGKAFSWAGGFETLIPNAGNSLPEWPVCVRASARGPPGNWLIISHTDH